MTQQQGFFDPWRQQQQVVPPPPPDTELRKRIEKLAEYIVKNG